MRVLSNSAHLHHTSPPVQEQQLLLLLLQAILHATCAMRRAAPHITIIISHSPDPRRTQDRNDETRILRCYCHTTAHNVRRCCVQACAGSGDDVDVDDDEHAGLPTSHSLHKCSLTDGEFGAAAEQGWTRAQHREQHLLLARKAAHTYIHLGVLTTSGTFSALFTARGTHTCCARGTAGATHRFSVRGGVVQGRGVRQGAHTQITAPAILHAAAPCLPPRCTAVVIHTQSSSRSMKGGEVRCSTHASRWGQRSASWSRTP